VAAVDATTGMLLYTTTTDWNPVAAAVDERTGHVFVVNNGASSVTMLDGRSGCILHTVSPATMNGSLVVAVAERSGRAFVPCPGGVDVLATANGQLLHTVSWPASASSVVAIAVDERTSRVFAVSSGAVSMLNAATGTLQRTVTIGRFARAVAVDERTNRVFVAGSGGVGSAGTGVVSVLDATTGVIMRTISVDRFPWAIAVDDRTDRVFVTSPATGRVDVLEATSGRLLRAVSLGPQTAAIAVDARRGHVFVTDVGLQDRPLHFVNSGTAQVGMLDARTGEVLRTLNMADHATVASIAVDERTGHLFVATIPGSRSDGWDGMAQGIRRWLPWFPGSTPRSVRGTVSTLTIAY